MIHLRNLKLEDAELMLEWMHDSDIQKKFKKNMMNMTIDDARDFCRKNGVFSDSKTDIHSGQSVHYAIADENDEYLGTISLKDIDICSGNAEYAISMRKSASGRGIGSTATELLLDIAFNQFELNRVYLNVLSNNTRAKKMYERCGFKYEGTFRQHILLGGKLEDLDWYGILADEYNSKK